MRQQQAYLAQQQQEEYMRQQQQQQQQQLQFMQQQSQFMQPQQNLFAPQQLAPQPTGFGYVDILSFFACDISISLSKSLQPFPPTPSHLIVSLPLQLQQPLRTDHVPFALLLLNTFSPGPAVIQPHGDLREQPQPKQPLLALDVPPPSALILIIASRSSIETGHAVGRPRNSAS